MPRLRNRTTIAFVLSISLVILIFFKIKPDLHAHFEVDNGDSSVRQLQREVNQNDGHQYMLEKQNFQYKDSKNEVQKVEEKNDMVHGDYEEDEDDKGWNFWNPMKKSNENDDTCRKRQTIKRLKSMSKSMGKSFVARIPIFLEQSLLQSADIQEFKVPFGVYGAESNFSDALQLLSNSALPVEVTNISCARCVIVGSGSVIKNTGLGPNIDKYDVVIRVNGGPVYSYESDVGTRTTIRISHPEGAPAKLDDYDPNAIFVLVAFKPVDLQWATLVATHDKVDLTKIKHGFWKGVANSMPNKPHQFRILNPAVVKETAFDHVKFPSFDGKMFKNVPTTGTIAVLMAARMCDTVDVAGFGYDYKRPNLPLHYYGNLQMGVIRTLKTHDFQLEREFLRDLVSYGVIKDLTGGLSWL